MTEIELALKNKTRCRLHDQINERPGIDFTGLKSTLNLNDSTLRYHLRYLQKRKMIKADDRMGKLRFFLFDLNPDNFSSERYGIDQLSKVQIKIIKIIDKNPGINQKELSSRSKINRFMLSYNIRKIMENGLVKLEKRGKNNHYTRIEKDVLKKELILVLMDDLAKGDIEELTYLKLMKIIHNIE